jgi:hypothetical protein
MFYQLKRLFYVTTYDKIDGAGEELVMKNFQEINPEFPRG